MKKVFTLMAIIAMFVLQGCEGPAGPPGEDGLIAEVFELKNVNFSYNNTDGYTIYQKLTPNIFSSDVVLIYRLAGTINSNTPIWQLIPRTLYLSQGELDYDFDFSKEDYTIFVRGTYNLATTPEYINNQTFRIVIVPGAFSGNLDTANYASVMSALHLNERDIQKVNF